MGPKRSGSSRAKRERLRKDYASLPKLNQRVDLCRYIFMARGTLDEAVAQYKRGNITSAYIELEKFFTLTVERLPEHPSFKNPNRDPKLASELIWTEKARNIAFDMMADVVEKMDHEEDLRLQYEMECRFFDEFENCLTTEPSSEGAETQSTVSSPYQAVIVNASVQAPSSAPLPLVGTGDGSLSILSNEPSTVAVERPPNSSTDPAQPQPQPLLPSSTQLVPPPILASAPATITSAVAMDLYTAPSLSSPSYSTTTTISSNGGGGSGTTTLVPVLLSLPLSPPHPPALSSPSVPLPVPSKSPLTPYSIPAGLFPPETLSLVRCLLQKPSFHIPTPASSVYDLRFAPGVETRLIKDDFHTSFAGFLSDVPSDLQLSPPAMELNRCFFVHLAIATGFHPFLLQFAFRVLVQEALRSQDCWYQELLVTVTKQADLVDANVLTFLWPVEFDAFRILFISTQSSSPIFTHFSTGNADAKEVVILCNREHFTLLQPQRQTAQQPMRIIDDLLSQAKRTGCVVQENDIQRDAQRSIQRALLSVL